MAIPAKQQQLSVAEKIEAALIKGDLEQLTVEERVVHYNNVCESLGLNPKTQPFGYIRLNAKLVLYPLRGCTDQLRKINGISLHIVSQDIQDGVLIVHVKAIDKTGREDEDIGAVPFSTNLVGENRSNAVMKAITKAKRRVTLSISGLGWPDESEIDSIPGAVRQPPLIAPNVMRPVDPPHDAATGEITDDPQVVVGQPADQAPAPSTPTPAGAGAAVTAERQNGLEFLASEAAERGTEQLQSLWQGMTGAEHKLMKAAFDRVYKPRARVVDALNEEAERQAARQQQDDAADLR
jgi:hypothetical protein